MKSILLFAYDDDEFEARLQASFDLARSFDGHVTCLHVTPYEDYLKADPVLAAALPVEFSTKMRRMREDFRERVEARLAAEGVSWDWMHVDEDMATALIRQSALADVVVTNLGVGPALRQRDARRVAGGVAIHGRAPVLAVPERLERLRLDAPVVIAWNGSMESAAAVRGALPILKAAPTVHLLQIGDAGTIYSQEHAALFLSRHDVHPEIVTRTRLHRNIGEAIGREARELGAGIVVMGAYGHSRLRELVMGGATMSMLEQSPIPLLMAR
jgi:nucleotide-binding universal stress UspA family protein